MWVAFAADYVIRLVLSRQQVRFIRSHLLDLAIIVLPLMIPTLIFGVSAAEAALGGTVPLATPLTVLAALSLIAAVVGTLAAAAALRWSE